MPAKFEFTHPMAGGGDGSELEWALAMWIRRNFITHYIIIHYGCIEIRTEWTYYLNILLILLHLLAHRTSQKAFNFLAHTHTHISTHSHPYDALISENDKKIHWERKPIPSNYIVWDSAIVSMMLLHPKNEANATKPHNGKLCADPIESISLWI